MLSCKISDSFDSGGASSLAVESHPSKKKATNNHLLVAFLLCMFEVPQLQQLASEDSVPETPSYGTEWTFGAQNSLLWYATHLQKHSV